MSVVSVGYRIMKQEMEEIKRSSNRSFLIYRRLRLNGGLPGGLVGKEYACNAGDTEDPVSIPESGKIPCRRA